MKKWRASGNSGVGQLGRLAVALARESFFGEATMAVCTVSGKGPFKALPAEGMDEIYHIVLSQCPDLHVEDFEKVWGKCKSPINHACNCLRAS